MTDPGRSSPPASPVPRGVQLELKRLGERWQTLPLTQALSYAVCLRGLAQQLADRVARHTAGPAGVVPDLGPAAALDQLRVLVYDASLAGLADGLEQDLAALRRHLGER